MRGQTVKALHVDARQGGRIVEVGSDGHEHLSGTIKRYDPHSYPNLDFHKPSATSPRWSRAATAGPGS
jgi:hypothetical protein